MSASTAAATAATPAVNNNPSLTLDPNSRPYTRRKAAVSVEKKSNVEVVGERGINGVVDDTVLANGKDLSHTIRGETVLERAKDLPQLKKGLVTSSNIGVSPKRKKNLTKPEKSKWLTVLSVVLKNCLLFGVLWGVGHAIWKLTDNIGDDTSSPSINLDYEGRISEVQASLKKAAEMLQVQLEVVDRKIGKEIGVVTNVLKQVEERDSMFAEELNKLGARADYLDKSLGEIKDTGFLSKEEFESFWNDLKKSGSLYESDKDVNLDHIRAVARDIVQREIEKHAADGLGRVDYALGSGGGKVVRHSEPYLFGKAKSWLSAAISRNGVHANAQKMLEPSFGEPGQCFPLQGSTGFVEIKLRSRIIPEAVTLEHVYKSVAYDRTSAPKDCRVTAWSEGSEDRTVILTEFSYDLGKSNAQTFSVEPAEGRGINMVRFEFSSNHGNTALTCIYRLRVHGYEPNSDPAMPMLA